MILPCILPPQLHGINLSSVPCSAFSEPSLLGMRVQHLQFMSMYTRLHVFSAMRWFANASAPAGTCAASPAQMEPLLPAALRVVVLIGSAVANFSIVCLPGREQSCPCCWLAPPSLAKETTGCPVWNPYK